MKLEVLNSKRKDLLKSLYKFSDFYLVGGTALALQLGHRTSVDFDLFSDKIINPSLLLSKTQRIFQGRKVARKLKHSDQVSILVDDVKIDFVHCKYPLVLKPIELNKLKMAQAKEIAAMKAFALNFRGTTKDYIDLYFVLKEKVVTLSDIEKIGEKKYKDEFNFRLFLNQLLLLEDLEDTEIEFFKKEPTKEEMQQLFKSEIAKIKL
ncbi:MAG: nucleotidyl transferase AbiEii/AbiGii toxin family protein [bacterium]|nr:nucleotidyl transferase AbiEii/AbiGii toxin family protein [bacterium]